MPTWWPSWRARAAMDKAFPVAVAAVIAAFGAPLGWLWAVLAPDVPIRVVEGGLMPVDPQPEQFFAADGWFVLLGVAFGGLAAIGVWFLARRCRGPVGLVALTAGTIGAGLLAWWLGHRIGLVDYQRQVRQAAVGVAVNRPPDLRAKELGWWLGFIPRVQGDLLVPAVVAAVGYTVLAAWSRYPSLGRGTEPDGGTDPADPELADSGLAETDPAGAEPPQVGPGRSGQLELDGTASSDSGTGTART